MVLAVAALMSVATVAALPVTASAAPCGLGCTGGGNGGGGGNGVNRPSSNPYIKANGQPNTQLIVQRALAGAFNGVGLRR